MRRFDSDLGLMPENAKPEISYRSFVKLPDNTISRQSSPPPSRPSISEEIQLKKTEQLDLSLPENRLYTGIIKDVKKDIIKVYKSVGINIKQGQFSELILSTKKIGQPESRYYRRENIGVVAVGDRPSLHDILAIYHELGHGISSRTEIDSPEGDLIYGSTGLQTTNKKARVGTGRFLEEGLVQYLSYKYLADSQDKHLRSLRKEYLDKALEDGKFQPNRYPRTKDQLYSYIAHILLHPNGYYAISLERIEDLFDAADVFDKRNGKHELLSKLLWARVNPKNKRKLIHYLDKITKPGMGSRTFYTPGDMEQEYLLNREIRRAYISKRK